jgi:parvulin-like peptidyl-prolyl isomerase
MCKKFILYFALIINFGYLYSRICVDKIVARVNGVNILQSDLDTPRLTKGDDKYSLEELITEELLCQRSAQMHLLPSDLELERQMVVFKMNNNMGNMSDEDFAKDLEKSGLSIKLCKEQLRRILAVERLKKAEATDKIVVTSQEVETHYQKHPVYCDESYYIILIPTDRNKSQEDLGWVNKKDLDKQLNFVQSLKVGEISKRVNIKDQEYQVKLKDRKDAHYKSLKERYGEIERKISNDKKQKVIKSFEKKLREKAVIVYLK